jgi:hypothetical protein
MMTAFLSMVAILLWVFRFYVWIENLTHVSVVQRNNSLIDGILAVIACLVWTCLRMPSATVRTAESVLLGLYGLVNGYVLGSLEVFGRYSNIEG